MRSKTLSFGCFLLVVISLCFSFYVYFRIRLKIKTALVSTDCHVLAARIGSNIIQDNYKMLDIAGEQHIDRWGTKCQVVVRQSMKEGILSVKVVSAGPDKRMGTCDDIVAIYSHSLYPSDSSFSENVK